MKRFVPWMMFLSLCYASLVNSGCSRPAEPRAEVTPPATSTDALATKPNSSGDVAASPAAPFDMPDRAVAAFLKALRDGDDRLAEALLTPKAREETAKRNLAVQPPGTPTATFEIGQTEYLSADKTGAHVKSVWTERDEKQGSLSYDIVWALRRQNDGWHIAGMATQVTPSESPVFLNFEDPDDMLDKWRAAEERLAAQDGNLRQASQPQTSPASTPQTR